MFFCWVCYNLLIYYHNLNVQELIQNLGINMNYK